MLPVLPGKPVLCALLAFALAGAIGVPLAAQTPENGVTGVVRNERGVAVPGATVVAENREATPHMFMATTDEGGGFVFVGLKPGQWNVSASAPGYLLSQVAVQVGRGRAKAVTLVVKKGLWEVPDDTEGNLGKTGSRAGSGGSPASPAKSGSREATKNLGGLSGVALSRLQTALRNADTLLAAKQYDQAIASYQDVLQQAPALTLVNLQIAEAWRMKKDYERAIAACRAVLAADASNEIAMEAMAALELESGHPDAAEEILVASAGRRSPGRSTLCTLGDVKAAQGQPENAADWYRKAAAADPAWTRPVLKLGLLAVRQQDREAAITLLEKVIRMAPDSEDAADAARALRELKNRS